jgi:hypothetical protein
VLLVKNNEMEVMLEHLCGSCSSPDYATPIFAKPPHQPRYCELACKQQAKDRKASHFLD